MKNETPWASESCSRMLVHSATGGRRSAVAQTGPPACASTMLTPMARSSVLLPDMLEPVTSKNVPGGPTVTSFTTRAAPGSSGCPNPVATSAGASGASAGRAQSGLSKRKPASALSASASPSAASQPRTRPPATAFQLSSAAKTCTSQRVTSCIGT